MNELCTVWQTARRTHKMRHVQSIEIGGRRMWATSIADGRFEDTNEMAETTKS